MTIEALHESDISELIRMLEQTIDFAGLIADVENDREYNIITALIDDSQEHAADLNDLLLERIHGR